MMLGAGESPTPSVHTIILRDDYPFPPERFGALMNPPIFERLEKA
jgi:hypothetical protein